MFVRLNGETTPTEDEISEGLSLDLEKWKYINKIKIKKSLLQYDGFLKIYWRGLEN